MKRILLIVLILVLCSCSDNVKSTGMPNHPGISILVIDSCEYVYYEGRITHKGNCKYCRQRMVDLLKQYQDTLK